jgi:hypothetical protein
MANNPPYTTEVYIRFCEVPRIYDFVEGSALPSSAAPVVCRSFGVSGMTTVLRTFAREPEKQPIRPGSWVYLLRDNETSNKLRLFKILHFHASGKFRYVDLKTPEEVPTSGEEPGLFPLTFVVPVPWRTLRFCALLSPFPLPAEVLTALTNPTTKEHENLHARALARASWLHDPFTCDIVPATKAVPLTPDQVKNYAAGKCDKIDQGERILYLVNPFAEAAQRIGAYNDAVEKTVAAQMQAGRSKRYVLAKRIEAVVASDPKRKELVMPKLAQDIDRFESPIDALRWEAERRAEDVLRWCGYGWTARGWKWFGEFDMKKITFKAEGSRHVVYENELQPPQKTGANWIAAAAYETKYCSPELKESIGTLRSLFYSRLDQTKAGRDFLKLQTDRCLGDEPSKEGEDDGLMGALAATMKPADIVMQSWDGIVQNLLPWIYMRRGDLTFATLADFIQHKTGVNIRSPEVMEDRAKIAGLKQQNRAEYDARMKQAKRLIPRNQRSSEYYQRNADKALKAVQLLSRMAMFWEKLGEANKKKDSRSRLEAISSGLNAVELCADLVPKPTAKLKEIVEKLTQRSYYVRTESRVILPKLKFLGSIACGIDLVLALQDLGRSQGGGASIGYAMNALGAALGLGGAVASETGVGVVVALVGMALQLAGEWVIEHTDDLYKYLEKSPWGGEHKATSESPDVEDQRLATQLDKILYAYAWNPKYSPAHGLHPVDLEIQPGRGWRFLPSDASMDIDLLLSQDTMPPQRQQVNCTLSVDELIGVTSLTIVVARLTEIEVVGPLHLSGQITLKLDKQGTRALPANVAWSSVSTPDYAQNRDGAGGSL